MELSKKNSLIIWKKKPQLGKHKKTAWSSSIWIKSQLDRVKASKRRNTLDKNKKIIFNLLNKKLKINRLLDIGGGLGPFYYSLSKKKIKLDYYILEDSKLINKLKKKKLKKIKFTKKVPLKKFNIVFCVSSLHYIINWKSLFRKIIKNQPDYIVIIDLPVVNVQSFFGYQKYYSYQIKYRFQNKKEFKFFFKNKKYKLIKNITNVKSKLTQKKYYEKNFFKNKLFKVRSDTFIFKNNKKKYSKK
jgi:putative methyltransferase (TIGR04325 family)